METVWQTWNTITNANRTYYICINVYMDGWMDGRMDEWTNGWVYMYRKMCIFEERGQEKRLVSLGSTAELRNAGGI